MSDVFQGGGGADHVGTRSRRVGESLRDALVDNGVNLKEAVEYANTFIRLLGTPDIDVESKLKDIANKNKKDEVKKQKALDKFWSEKDPNKLVGLSPLILLSPKETTQLQGRIRESHASKLAADHIDNKKKVKEILSLAGGVKTFDMAMFGRMFTGTAANKSNLDMEAAVSVADSFAVHASVIESDFFSAVDDLNARTGITGSGFLGEQGFSSNLHYLYCDIDKTLLIKNLDGDVDMANKAIANLIECIATVSPSGKQKSHAAYSRASYMMVEKTSYQSRTLAEAFCNPVDKIDMIANAIAAIRNHKKNEGNCYRSVEYMEMVVSEGKGSLAELIKFATE